MSLKNFEELYKFDLTTPSQETENCTGNNEQTKNNKHDPNPKLNTDATIIENGATTFIVPQDIAVVA